MTFKIITYGCQMNVRDSETAAALLVAAGHEAINEAEEADLILVNSCSVRDKAESKAIGKLRELAAGKRKYPARIVGVMGCMAQRLGKELFKQVRGLDFAVGTRSFARLPQLAAAAAAGAGRQLALDGFEAGEEVPHAHLAGNISAYVTVLLGCNRRCSYCIVPDVRGGEYSRPPAEILAEIRTLLAQGVREVTLLGQSVLNYGKGNEVWQGAAPSALGYREAFPRLLEAVSALPGIERIRFTSGHPSGCSAELAHAMATLPHVAPHLHLPVQSGSDRILRLMRRGYTAAQYSEAVERLRAAVPDCAITSDFIVGFPGESESDFEASCSLMRQIGFDNCFIFKYSPRPNTTAAEMDDDVPTSEKQRRNQVMLAEQDRIGLARNEAWVGRVCSVLVEGPSLRNAARWSGRSEQNKIVVFTAPAGLGIGETIKVKITRAKPQTLYGKVVSGDK